MSRRKNIFPAMEALNLAGVAALMVVLLQFSAFASAQKAASSSPKWQTLDGSSPFVVARGGFSGLFPDSSSYAYNLAMMTSVPDVVLWCDVQLTKDGAGICFPNLLLNNASDVSLVYQKRKKSTYIVDGVKTEGYFPIDFTLKELASVSLTQGDFTRLPSFDGSKFQIQTVDDVFSQNKPFGLWLNVQNDAFYSQHNLSMRSFVISASKRAIITHISSPQASFLRGLARPFASTKTSLIFRFLDQDMIEPSTNQTYGTLSKNLTFIKSFASGILVPKTYIWPVDATSYLLPHTSLVADAHKIGLAVFASDFANDNVLAYNYSFNPVTEYLSFFDNGEFAVDGVLSDFPITPSEARDCFAHVGKNASAQAKPLVISHFGASGDFPACTDLSYTKAISDGADVIDCPVQMSKDGVPFCLSTVNLMNNTLVTQTGFRTLLSTVSEIQSNPGIFSFSLNWADIQGLTPVISSPFTEFGLSRNPKSRNAGKLISLSDFLTLAKNASSLSGVSITIENAKYLASQGLGVTEAVLDALEKAGYNGPGAKKVMIQSTNSSVLKPLKGKKYELVYEVDEIIRGASNATIADIKSFADSVVVKKKSVFVNNQGFLLGVTDVVSKLKSFKLNVYAQIFTNEFVSIPYDFFSDPIAEINSYVMGTDIDGVITEYPQSAAAYKRNRCLTMKTTPPYMSAVQPGSLIQLVTPELAPPAEAPSPLLNVSDVSEAPLPPVADNASPPTAEAPKLSPNGQQHITASPLLSCLAMIGVVALLF